MKVAQTERIPFAAEEYASRVHSVRKRMQAAQLDVLLVNKPENIFYLSGYETHGYFWFQLLVVPLAGEPYFIIRALEESNVRLTSLYKDYIQYGDSDDPVAITSQRLRAAEFRRVGLEMNSWFITPAQYRALSESLTEIKLVDCSDIVDECRAVKSQAEITYIRAAGRIADKAVQAGLESIAKASADTDINAAVIATMIRAGGEYPALWPFVTNGETTERFHVSWTGAPVRSGDLVFMHVPGVVRRYLAGVGRTGARAPLAATLRDRYALLCEAQHEGLARMRPGITAAEAYAAFAAPIVRAGFKIGQAGYSIGINFPPRWSEWGRLRLNPGCRTVLEAGMVFHTPLTIREPGEQTPILSNTIVLTSAGFEKVTNASEMLEEY